MAIMVLNGVEEISGHEFENLEDDDYYNVLEAGADLVIGHYSDTIKQKYKTITGALASSWGYDRKHDSYMRYINVYPHGKHPKTKAGRRGAGRGHDGHKISNGHYAGSNMEIMLFLEEGTPRIEASHVIDKTGAIFQNEVYDAMQAKFNELTK